MLGFAITGSTTLGSVMKKGGMCPGERLILTKPLGTGTILAAEMRKKALGRWVQNAVAWMAVSNKGASEVAVRFKASACTDVTGFGLVGHLSEMCKASKVKVRLWAAKVPTLPGALECIESGIFSSLQPANLRLRRAVLNEAQAVSLSSSIYPLLFDPRIAE